MKHLALAAAAVVTTSGAWAAEIAPTQVAFEDGSVTSSLSGAPGDPAAGALVMNRGAGNCVACHQVTALPQYDFQGNVGPSLDGVGDRWEEAQLRGIIANAKMMFPETVMPSFYKTEGFTRPGNAYTGKAAEGPLEPLLTAQQIEDVVAYLLTLKE